MDNARRVSWSLVCLSGLVLCIPQCGNSDSERTVVDDGGAAGASQEGGTTSSLTRFGVTWHFASPVPYGTFANGDYWVLGPVTLSAIEPTPTGERNGFDVNPVPAWEQVFDGRAEGFDSTRYAELAESFPRLVNGPASIVSTISVPEDYECELWGESGYLNYKGDCRGGLIKSAAILTVVDAPPAEGSFRPPYAGTNKPFYDSREIRWGELLTLEPEAEAPDLTELAETWARPRLDIKTNSAYDQVYPIDCVAGSSTSNYGAQLVMSMGEAALTLLSDYSNEQKRLLMIRFVQHGIDQYGALLAGATWAADGGLKSGRKFPIVWAGFFLGDDGMQSVNVRTGTFGNDWETAEPFSEDCQTYYDDDPEYAFYYGVPGMPRWGIGHCQTSEAGNNDEMNDYRLCCNTRSWLGQTLAMRLLGLETLWGHQAYFDYVDGYWHTEFPNGGHGSAWNEAMWTRYRPTVDTCANGVQDVCSVLCDPESANVSGEEGVDCGGECAACP